MCDGWGVYAEGDGGFGEVRGGDALHEHETT
jgi:hypothetical protein